MSELPKSMPPPSAPMMIPTENNVVVEDTITDDVRMDHTQTHTAESNRNELRYSNRGIRPVSLRRYKRIAPHLLIVFLLNH